MEQTIQNILADKRFYELLLGFDRQIADAAHEGRCRRCGTNLHCGSFARKPRGVPAGLGPEHCERFSFCCAARECRKRDTPGSLRFLGRKVFLGAMVVLITAMQSGLNPARARQLDALVGVSRRTVVRWRDWWCRVFTESPFWRAQGQAARDFLVRFPEVHDGYDRLGMVYEARGDKKQAAHYYRQVINFVRAHPDQYEPAFVTTFLQLIEELDPPPAG